MDTNGTFELLSTKDHLKSGRGSHLQGLANIDHFNEVQRKISYWREHPELESGELPILIAKDIEGPYTIIDGTHRFIARYLQDNTASWPVLLGVSAECKSCQWYVGSQQADNLIQECNELKRAGHIW